MDPKIEVEFCITGLQIAPDEITRLTGIPPTKTWISGDIIQETALRRRFNGWCISMDTNILGIGQATRKLVNVLLTKKETINKLCAEYELDCELSCAIYIIDETPVVNFGQDIISDLAILNAAIDIDLILTK
jgi:Domain of unknown function (DUF4279)